MNVDRVPPRPSRPPAVPPPSGGWPPCSDGCGMATRCQHFGRCRIAAVLGDLVNAFLHRTDGRRL